MALNKPHPPRELETPRGSPPHPIIRLPNRSLMRAVRQAVIYAEIFDFALTADEVWRYLPVPVDSTEELEAAVTALVNGGVLERAGDYVVSRGRRKLATHRQSHRAFAAWLWRRTRRYARLVYAVPAVRMVAVTGSVAARNVGWHDDIDLFVVTEPGRLWLTRALVLAICRWAALWGDTLCPNFLVSTDALALGEGDFYAAHEVAHMVPLHGRATYTAFIEANDWYLQRLPNAVPCALDRISDRLPAPLRLLKAVGRQVIASPLGELFERWEQQRKIARLTASVPAHIHEALYTPSVCKGHDRGHGARIMSLWERRIANLS
jgi:hypothetical protein